MPGILAPVQALLRVNGEPGFMALSSLARKQFTFLLHFYFSLKRMYYVIIGGCFEYNKNDPEFVIQPHIVLQEWEERWRGWWAGKGLSQISLSGYLSFFANYIYLPMVVEREGSGVIYPILTPSSGIY